MCPTCTRCQRAIFYQGAIHLCATRFHPVENGTRTHPMNPEIFVGRCLFLQNHGFNVTVNVVAWPEQMYLIPAWAEMFRSHGLRFHFYPRTRRLRTTRTSTRRLNDGTGAVDLGKPPSRTSYSCRRTNPTQCCAPAASITSMSSPVAPPVRCILERQLAINPLGNVFDLGFELLESPLPCAESWQCPACDRDKVRSEHASDRTTSS